MLEYLATPYYHENEHIRALRFTLAAGLMSHLQTFGRNVFSPIAHSHTGHLLINNPEERWLNFDKTMLKRCDKLLIVHLAGWDASRGIALEIGWAKEFGLEREAITADYLVSIPGAFAQLYQAHEKLNGENNRNFRVQSRKGLDTGSVVDLQRS